MSLTIICVIAKLQKNGTEGTDLIMRASRQGQFNPRDFARCRILWQVFEQVQRLLHTTGVAGMGRAHNELPLLQLQRQHERQEDKARLRVQPGLLPGPDSQRQRGFPQTEQTQFRPEAGDAGRELPSTAWPGRLGAAVLASLLQRHDSSVSIHNVALLLIAELQRECDINRSENISVRIYQ